MATKAERFRYEAERLGEKKPKQAPKKKVSTGDPEELVSRNASERAGRKAVYALEVTESGRPSRKSTRKAANRQKNDVQFRLEKKVSHLAARPTL